MFILIIILSYLDPFKAEIKEFKGDRLIKQDTVLVYYMLFEEGFYVSTGSVTFDGVRTGDDKTFKVKVSDTEEWFVYILTEKHLVLTSRQRTVIIRGL